MAEGSGGMDLFALALKVVSQGTDAAIEGLEGIDAAGIEAAGGVEILNAAFATLAAAVAPLLAAFEAVEVIKESVSSANETAESFERLETIVKNTGNSYEQLNPHIRATIDALHDQSTFTTGELNEAFTRLLAITGNVSEAEYHLTDAVNLATFSHQDLASAASIVGRAIEGQVTRSLRAVVGPTQDADEALRKLRTNLGGFAEKEALSSKGQLELLNRSWKEFTVGLGDAITHSEAYRALISGLTTLMRGLTDTVTSGSAIFKFFADLLGGTVKVAFEIVALPIKIVIGLIEYLKTPILAITSLFIDTFVGPVLQSLGALLKGLGDVADGLDAILSKVHVHILQGVGSVIRQTGESVQTSSRTMTEALLLDLANIDNATTQTVAKQKQAVSGAPTSDPNAHASKDDKADKADDKDALDEYIKSIQEQIRIGEEAIKNDATRAAGMRLLAEAQQELTAMSQNASFDIERRTQLSGELETATKSLTQAEKDQVLAIAGARLGMSGADYEKYLEDMAKKADEAREKLKKTWTDIVKDLQDTLVKGMEAGFDKMFKSGSISQGLTTFGKTILKGIGTMFTQMGESYLQFGQIVSALEKLLGDPFTAGPAGIAIGVALIALGASLGAIASGGTGAGASAYRAQVTDTTVYQNYGRQQGASGLSPATPVGPNTFIGPNDPQVQRQLAQIVQRASQRGYATS